MKNIKVLDDYIKAYHKQKEAQETLDKIKLKALDFIENNGCKIEYKDKSFILCQKKTFQYSYLAKEMHEAAFRQKKIEELDGTALVKLVSNYIRMSELKG